MHCVARLQSDSLAVIERSLVRPQTTRLTGRRIDGAPVYEYVRTPDAPPVSVLRFSSDQLPVAHMSRDHAHAHDFLVLAYFEHGGGSLRLGEREWPLTAGDAFVIAPGEVVRLNEHGHNTRRVAGLEVSPAAVPVPRPDGRKRSAPASAGTGSPDVVRARRGNRARTTRAT
jgi:quercetin dioxygenase-like cupin family protein